MLALWAGRRYTCQSSKNPVWVFQHYNFNLERCAQWGRPTWNPFEFPNCLINIWIAYFFFGPFSRIFSFYLLCQNASNLSEKSVRVLLVLLMFHLCLMDASYHLPNWMAKLTSLLKSKLACRICEQVIMMTEVSLGRSRNNSGTFDIGPGDWSEGDHQFMGSNKYGMNKYPTNSSPIFGTSN